MRPLALVPALLLIATQPVSAGSKSRHERVEIHPIHKQGDVIGFRLKLTLRPENNHDKVRIGLGPNTNSDRDQSPESRSRAKAADRSLGYLLHQWPEIKIEKSRQPQKVELEVLFKDNPKLSPGQQVEIISAWNGPIGSFWHIWGLQAYAKDPSNLARLPGATASQRQASMLDIKRAGKRAAPHRKRAHHRHAQRGPSKRAAVRKQPKARRSPAR